MKHEADMLYDLPIAHGQVGRHFSRRQFLVQGHNISDIDALARGDDAPAAPSYGEGEIIPSKNGRGISEAFEAEPKTPHERDQPTFDAVIAGKRRGRDI